MRTRTLAAAVVILALGLLALAPSTGRAQVVVTAPPVIVPRVSYYYAPAVVPSYYYAPAPVTTYYYPPAPAVSYYYPPAYYAPATVTVVPRLLFPNRPPRVYYSAPVVVR